MASTVQQYNAASQTLNTSIQSANDDLASLTAEVKAIQANPTQPNAQQKLDILKERVDAVTGGVSSDVQGKRYELTQVYNSLPPSDQKQLSNQLVQSSQATNNVINQTQALRGDLLVAQNAVSRGVPIASDSTQKGTGEDVKQDDSSTGNTSPAPIATAPSPRPRPNPLGNFASYTYQLSLYMITPDAYDAFVTSGRKNINALRDSTPEKIEGGAFIIAQSGGINSKYRLEPDFHLDYYIDNLSMTTHTAGDSEINTTHIQFNIIEPYGFSFLSNLRRAHEKILGYSGALSDKFENPLKQFYVLGIRFYGYDEAGNILTGKDKLASGEPLDPAQSLNGIHERFFDIIINDLNFKLDGKAVVYTVKSTIQSTKEGLGLKRGTVKQGVTIEASTVEEALKGIVDKMNYTEQTTSDEPRNTYSVEYIGDAEALKQAYLVGPNDPLKGAWASSGVKNSLGSNESASIKASPNSTKKLITIPSETTVVSAFNSVVKQSEYMTKALDVLYSTQQSGGAGIPTTNNSTDTYITWYNLSCQVKNARWNSSLADWVYDIIYVVQPYATPAIYSPFISKKSKYYGPHKRYEYWYTGKNSEVMSYEQAFNSSYFTVSMNQQGLQPDPGAGYGSLQVPIASGKRTAQSRMGSPNLGFEAQNQVLTSLYDPGGLVNAKLSILGDPDYLASEANSSLNQVYDRFYGIDGYTINPNSGQVFIEIDFKEAVDYDTDKGFLSINDSILFWKYAPSIAKSIKGVCYQIINIASKFEAGKFTQTLQLAIQIFGENDIEITQATGKTDNSSSQNEGQRSDAAKDTENANAQRRDSRQLMQEINSARAATEGSLKTDAQLAADSGLKPAEVDALKTVPVSDFKPTIDKPVLGAINLGPISNGDD